MTPTGPTPVNAESFQFRTPARYNRRRPKRPINKRVSLIRKRQGARIAFGHASQSNPYLLNLQLLQDPPSHWANILANVVMYIDNAVDQYNDITKAAIALGAQVADKIDDSVTHIVRGPSDMVRGNKQRLPKTINQALERNIRLVSPLWIVACLQQEQRLSEIHYPYDITPNRHVHLTVDESASANADNDNPFNLDADELETSSSEDERPRTIMDYFHPVEDQQSTQECSPQPQSFSSAPMLNSLPSQSMEHDMIDSTPPVHDSGMSDAMIDEEAARRERRERRMLEVKKILRAVRQSRDRGKTPPEDATLTSMPEDSPRNALLGGDERLGIWYGEQSFYYDSQQSGTSSRRRSNRKTKE